MNPALCRACLSETDKIKSIRNTRYQEVFEKLSNTKLIAEDGRPDTVCYTCFSQLKRCHNFSIMSQKADKMLTQLYCDKVEIPPAAVATLHRNLGALQNSPDNNHPLEEYIMQVDVAVKEEPDPVKLELIEIEERYIDENIKIEGSPENNAKEKKTPFIEKSLKKPKKQRKHVKNNSENSNICKAEKDSLQRHKLLKKKLPYSCDMCEKMFAHNTNLKAHIKIHIGKKSSACDRCGKTFPSGYQLKRHMRSHTGEKPYTCDLCQRTFADRSNLKKHIANHSGLKSYNCTECNASFSQMGNLRRHKRSHTGEKPFFCDLCQKALPDASLLKRHIRIHTGEKPYVCDACGKAYSDKDNFRNHLRLHSGEKPYACTLCDYRSAHANCLKLHLAKKHSS